MTKLILLTRACLYTRIAESNIDVGACDISGIRPPAALPNPPDPPYRAQPDTALRAADPLTHMLDTSRDILLDTWTP